MLNRWKSILFQSAQYNISRRFPNFMRKTLMTMAQRRLPEGYDVAEPPRSQLQPVGSAPVPGAQRGSLQDDPRGQGRTS